MDRVAAVIRNELRTLRARNRLLTAENRQLWKALDRARTIADLYEQFSDSADATRLVERFRAATPEPTPE